MTPDPPQLSTASGSGHPVRRVGFRPEPWAWPSWQYATDGRFPGRWDDADGNFRTIYAGTRLLSCLLEVLACFRADTTLADQMTDIVDNDDEDAPHPTIPTGVVPRSWLQPRLATTAQLSGTYTAITDAASVAALRPVFLARAQQLGLDDFDAAALKDARPRALTQQVATCVYETTVLDGVPLPARRGPHSLGRLRTSRRPRHQPPPARPNAPRTHACPTCSKPCASRTDLDRRLTTARPQVTVRHNAKKPPEM
ncbi:MAG: hypothetical protein ABJA74_16120 [Lapillicoccus sp.]